MDNYYTLQFQHTIGIFVITRSSVFVVNFWTNKKQYILISSRINISCLRICCYPHERYKGTVSSCSLIYYVYPIYHKAYVHFKYWEIMFKRYSKSVNRRVWNQYARYGTTIWGSTKENIWRYGEQTELNQYIPLFQDGGMIWTGRPSFYIASYSTTRPTLPSCGGKYFLLKGNFISDIRNL